MTTHTTQTPLHASLNAWIARLNCVPAQDGNWLQAHAVMRFAPETWRMMTRSDDHIEEIRQAYNDLCEGDLYGDQPGINEGTGQLPMWMNHFIHQAMRVGQQAALTHDPDDAAFIRTLNDLAMVNGGITMYGLADSWTAWALWGAYSTLLMNSEDAAGFNWASLVLSTADWMHMRTWPICDYVMHSVYDAYQGHKQLIRMRGANLENYVFTSAWYGTVYDEFTKNTQFEEGTAETISVYRFEEGKPAQLVGVTIVHYINSLEGEFESKTFWLD